MFYISFIPCLGLIVSYCYNISYILVCTKYIVGKVIFINHIGYYFIC